MTNTFTEKLRQLAADHVASYRERYPHSVAQPGLLRLALSEDRFLAQMDIRRRWIGQNCKRGFWVDDLIANGEVGGKLYRFQDIHDAVWFRFVF